MTVRYVFLDGREVEGTISVDFPLSLISDVLIRDRCEHGLIAIEIVNVNP